MKERNKIKDLLIELGICTKDSILPYFPRVRDRDNISVLKCNKSGVILLSHSDHMDISHYTKKDLSYWNPKKRKTGSLAWMEDAQRRCNQFKIQISDKKWLDVGTGFGKILDLLSPVALETVGIEPQEAVRKFLSDKGYKVYSVINDAQDETYEVVTLFHVLEHFTDPIDTLSTIRQKMVKGAKIIIEIPHARDFLISFLENEAFKASTFWSEHLILHTRESVTRFLETAGFSEIIVKGYQRFPFANHLYWIMQNKPGGHIFWSQLRTLGFDCEYANMLSAIDKTDTLIAEAKNF
jgi:2-polyprenyl-3-methyl-5-hydroxy-6-metoxy-1,4-benzoquinol methylase